MFFIRLFIVLIFGLTWTSAGLVGSLDQNTCEEQCSSDNDCEAPCPTCLISSGVIGKCVGNDTGTERNELNLFIASQLAGAFLRGFNRGRSPGDDEEELIDEINDSIRNALRDRLDDDLLDDLLDGIKEDIEKTVDEQITNDDDKRRRRRRAALGSNQDPSEEETVVSTESCFEGDGDSCAMDCSAVSCLACPENQCAPLDGCCPDQELCQARPCQQDSDCELPDCSQCVDGFCKEADH